MVYHGWAIERVVEPAVLPWIDGRRSDRCVVERTVLLWIVAVRAVYGGWAIEWVIERLVLLGNHGRTGGSILR